MKANMWRRSAIGTCLSVFAGSFTLSVTASEDIVIHGGTIYTADEARPLAQALVVREGKLIHVGTSAMAQQVASPDAKWIDASGKMVLPGFHDSHIHTYLGGRSILGCDVASAETIHHLEQMLQACFSTSQETWLIAEGLNLGFFDQQGPSLVWMNAINDTKPVLLRASDGHALAVNAVAMRLADITPNTPTPPAGVIERNVLGHPTGTLRESAMQLVERHLPPETFETRMATIQAALAEMNRHGITSAFDAWVGSDDVAVYRHLDKNDKLTVKIRAALAYGHGDLFTLDSSEDYAWLLEQREVLSTTRFTLGAVKLFVDGVLEGETAALLSPYIDSEGSHGHLTYEQKSLNKIVSELVQDGVQIYTHAIGDGGVRSILDAFEAVRDDLGDSDLRHQVSHLQLIHPDDQHRFAQLGVVANFQPLWALPDEWIMSLNLPVLGMKRVERMYPIASIRDSGAMIVAGSDWNVSSLNPLEAIEVALLRQDWIGNDQLTSESLDHLPILNRAERVDLETILLAYTSNGAWGMHQEDSTGRLKVGMDADIVVLSEDLFATPVQHISSVQVERTYVDGNLVYLRSDD